MSIAPAVNASASVTGPISDSERRSAIGLKYVRVREDRRVRRVTRDILNGELAHVLLQALRRVVWVRVSTGGNQSLQHLHVRAAQAVVPDHHSHAIALVGTH